MRPGCHSHAWWSVFGLRHPSGLWRDGRDHVLRGLAARGNCWDFVLNSGFGVLTSALITYGTILKSCVQTSSRVLAIGANLGANSHTVCRLLEKLAA
jgi:hypothetical protein